MRIDTIVTEINRGESVASETAFLVGVTLGGQQPQTRRLAELEGLAEAAGCRVVGHLLQRRSKPTSATYLGSGKVAELTVLSEAAEADVIIFDNDLSAAQTRNLEKATGIKVIDRSELILDIFASRARTHQARLAVELAQLEYALPRLKRMWTHLSRQKNGVGLRGPGEQQLEVDRRLASRRIRDLGQQLAVIERRKQREVAARRQCMSVSLVGYTNAGKSTLLNTLTGADVFVKDALFATLDTRTRRWQLPGWGPVLLSDTVGFIRDLPHHLIESFKATLEEARCADLLLHVADVSHPEVAEQISSAYGVLKEIGIDEKDSLLVLNKADRLAERHRIEGLRRRYPHAIVISAVSGEGISALSSAVSDALSRGFLDVNVETSVDDGRLLAYLAAHGEVFSKRYHDHRVTVHCRLAEKFIGAVRRPDVEITPYTNGTPQLAEAEDAHHQQAAPLKKPQSKTA